MDTHRQRLLGEKLAEFVSKDWHKAAQLQRLSGGDSIEVVKALDLLWQAGPIDREMQDLAMAQS